MCRNVLLEELKHVGLEENIIAMQVHCIVHQSSKPPRAGTAERNMQAISMTGYFRRLDSNDETGHSDRGNGSDHFITIRDATPTKSLL